MTVSAYIKEQEGVYLQQLMQRTGGLSTNSNMSILLQYIDRMSIAIKHIVMMPERNCVRIFVEFGVVRSY